MMPHVTAPGAEVAINQDKPKLPKGAEEKACLPLPSSPYITHSLSSSNTVPSLNVSPLQPAVSLGEITPRRAELMALTALALLLLCLQAAQLGFPSCCLCPRGCTVIRRVNQLLSDIKYCS